METAEVKKAVGTVLEQIKKESFVDGYKASDEEAMGLLVSKYFEWDGLSILRASHDALEDANFHSEAEVVDGLLERGNK